MAADHRQSEADLLQKLATRMRESLLPVDQPFANGDLEQAAALVLETATRRTAGEPAISITDDAQGSSEGRRRLRMAIVSPVSQMVLMTSLQDDVRGEHGELRGHECDQPARVRALHELVAVAAARRDLAR